MTHEIASYDHYVADDSIIWGFQTNEDGSAKDLNGASVEYEIVEGNGADRTDAIVDDTDSGVTVDVEPSSGSHPDAPSDTTGYIEVTIDRGNLDRGGENLWQRVRIDDATTGRRTFGGNLYVQLA